MSDKLKILVVDADSLYGRLARTILKETFDVEVVQSPFDAFEILQRQPVDIVIADNDLPGGNGLRFIRRVKQINSSVEIIMTGLDTPTSVIDEAFELGATDFFKKPFDYEDVKLAIGRTKKFVKVSKQLKRAERDNEILVRQIETKSPEIDLVSVSKEMEYVKQMMKKVAQSSGTSVIITGESGVGKELVAHGIHALSERKDNYFGAVNMSAISESLFESEFFGHKKGSFTGAIADRSGWFEVADKGTLFLDEIGDMPINLQIKMLRVLEDRKYVKVGSQQEQSFDIRIIAATNKDINEMKSGKNFRLDLFHRIGTFEIYIPPLRERRDDIPVLVHFFMGQFSQRMRKKVDTIDKETLQKLQNYTFPGNVRELRNLVERAVILSDSTVLADEHFPNILLPWHEPVVPDTLFDLEKIEKMVILKALEKTGYNKSHAAKLLNLNWNALHRRLTKYNIEVS